ncbi:MAG: ABC transporter permease [Lachnospiraceae bacterium]|nr:ABC transporter permease [Lachnospiraceae bacterium]
MIKMIKKYRRPVLLVTDVIFIILAVIIFVRVRNAYDTLYHVQESKRWSTKDMPSAQIDVYVSENKAISTNDINSVRAKIVKDLTTDGLIEEGNKKRIWADSFSAETEVEIKKDGNMYSANAVLTGGDFFLFHPIPVISGSYISESDEDPYRIVLDETMAWSIFGSTDVEGMEVFIGNRIYTVAGVVKVDKGKFAEATYGSKGRVFILYKSYTSSKGLGTSETADGTSSDSGDSSATEDSSGSQDSLMILNYQAVLPNKVQNYASNIIKKGFGVSTDLSDEAKQSNIISTDEIEVIDNTIRYRLLGILLDLRSMPYRSMRVSSVYYPYWENEARYIQDQMVYAYVSCFLLFILPFLTIIHYIGKVVVIIRDKFEFLFETDYLPKNKLLRKSEY